MLAFTLRRRSYLLGWEIAIFEAVLDYDDIPHWRLKEVEPYSDGEIENQHATGNFIAAAKGIPFYHDLRQWDMRHLHELSPVEILALAHGH